MKRKKIVNRASHVVTHRITNQSRSGLTSVIRRERVLYTWYERSWRLGTSDVYIYVHASMYTLLLLLTYRQSVAVKLSAYMYSTRIT